MQCLTPQSVCRFYRQALKSDKSVWTLAGKRLTLLVKYACGYKPYDCVMLLVRCK